MKILFKLLLVVLLPIAAAIAFIWFQTTAQVERAFEQLNLFTPASYAGVTTTPVGTTEIRDISIRIPGTRQNLTIESVSLDAGNLWELLKMYWSAQNNEPPERLSVHFNDVRLPLSPALETSGAGFAPGNPLDAALLKGCGDKSTLTLSDYMAMGYTELRGSTDFSYRYDKSDGTLAVNIRTLAEQMFSLDIDAELGNVNLRSPISNPVLTRVSVFTREGDLKQRKINYCADLNGQSPQAYKDHHLQALTRYLQSQDIFLSDELYAGYREYLDNPDSLSLQFHPDVSFGELSQLSLYSPRNLANNLNLVVKINQRQVGEIFGFDPGVFVTGEEPAAVKTRGDEYQSNYHVVKWRPANTRQLTRNIGRRIRFSASSGREYQGVLLAVRSGRAEVEVWESGGKAIVRFALSKMRKLEIHE